MVSHAPCSGSVLSTAEIIITELRNCMEKVRQNCSGPSCQNSYQWLADTKTTRIDLNCIMLAEITDMCNRLYDSEVANVLRELHHYAHMSASCEQLLSHTRQLLSETIANQQSACEEQQSVGRRMSLSMIAGLRSVRRKLTPTQEQTKPIMESEKQTTV